MNRFLISSLLLIVVIGFFTYRSTFALFKNAASNNTSTFSAALEFATPSATIFPTPTDTENPPEPPNNIANHIVISEIQIGTGSAGSDFVELYNPTPSSIDLNGHRLVKRTKPGTNDDATALKSWTSSTIIPAHGYYLWASTSGGYAAQIHANASSSATIAADNSIALRFGPADTGTIIDGVAWGGGHTAPLGEGTPVATFSAGQSIERKAYSTSTQASMTSGADMNHGNGFDTNQNSINFVLRTTPQPQNLSSPIELP